MLLASGQRARAQQNAGITPPLAKGEKRKAARDQGMHALRHTAASAWLSAGADIVAVAAWLGDTVETVYKTYAHLMPDADERERTAIDQFFRRPGDEGVPRMCLRRCLVMQTSWPPSRSSSWRTPSSPSPAPPDGALW